ncbi:MAG: hypothetical protein JRJ12_13035 [Deltaproteobacteria bacterium]|nr:hypothetical protein [Deltaproteobacteria bacterium]
MSSKLKQMWQMAAEDLGIRIIAPFQLVLSSGVQIKAELLVKQFGAVNGMLIITNYDQVAPFVDEITNEGYGFSVLDEPRDNEKYSREDFIELLADWGWSGEDSSKPSWL